ncbi:hypothetical protein [Marinobacter sp. W-8]|uniref:hypothetical protein n=1 Tax=Marinobacter sp. W-8 TaxID=3369658 RepID=UPI0037C8467D
MNSFFVIEKDDVFDSMPDSLHGYAVLADSLVFGSKGLLDFKTKNPGFSSRQLKDGRFSAIVREGDEIVVKVDSTGQEILYLFQKNDDWIVSNSFLTLAKVASRNFSLSLYEASVFGFLLKDGVHIGEQLISNRTMIDEIRVVPLNYEIRVNVSTKKIRVVESCSLKDIMFSSLSYEESLLETIETGAGLLAALSSIGAPLNLFISGGYDSRLILAMLFVGLGYQIPENVHFTSNESKVDDFKSAKNLSTKLGFSINKFLPPRIDSTISSSDSFRQYLASCGGTYLPFYPVNSNRQSRNIYFRLTGDQPTGWSHFSGNGPFNGNAAKIVDDINKSLAHRGVGDLVSNEFLSTFDEMDLDPNDPYAMLLHYSAIRSRHHCGRNSYKSLGNVVLFTPLMQRKFIELELKNVLRGGVPKQLFCDAFLALADWAIKEPFETSDRSFGDELVSSSPFKSGVSIVPKKFQIYGSPSELFENDDSFDRFDLPINLKVDQDKIKDCVHYAFYTSDLARGSALFSDRDFYLANEELKGRGSLSHSYRKSLHIICTDIVLRLIEESKKNF